MNFYTYYNANEINDIQINCSLKLNDTKCEIGKLKNKAYIVEENYILKRNFNSGKKLNHNFIEGRGYSNDSLNGYVYFPYYNIKNLNNNEKKILFFELSNDNSNVTIKIEKIWVLQ